MSKLPAPIQSFVILNQSWSELIHLLALPSYGFFFFLFWSQRLVCLHVECGNLVQTARCLWKSQTPIEALNTHRYQPDLWLSIPMAHASLRLMQGKTCWETCILVCHPAVGNSEGDYIPTACILLILNYVKKRVYDAAWTGLCAFLF